MDQEKLSLAKSTRKVFQEIVAKMHNTRECLCLVADATHPRLKTGILDAMNDLERIEIRTKRAQEEYTKDTEYLLEEERQTHVLTGMERICEAWDNLDAEISDAVGDVEKKVPDANKYEWWDTFMSLVEFGEPKKTKMNLVSHFEDCQERFERKFRPKE